MTLTKHLIADYLKRHGLENSLRSFEREAGINSNGAVVAYEKLEDIINDRVAYLSHADVVKEVELNRVDNAQLFKPWGYDHCPNEGVGVRLGAGANSLVIHVSICKQFIVNDEFKDVGLLSSADKTVTMVDLHDGEVLGKYSGIHATVIKCCYGIEGSDKLLTCGMDGKLKIIQITSPESFETLSDCQLHPRLVTDFKLLQISDSEHLIFSIGWDLSIRAHRLLNGTKLEYLSSFKLLSNATALEVSTFQAQPIILLTRLDSSQIAYFTLKNDTLIELIRISLNDAEFSTHGFTGMCISLSSAELNNDTQIAVGSSHIPYLRVIITKPPADLEQLLTRVKEDDTDIQQQQLSTPTFRGHILANFITTSPQDKFSQAKILWRPNGSGIWISGDDGVIRGLNLKDGTNARELVGHDDKQRIKCLALSLVDDKEILISAGVDKKVILWK